MSPLDFQGIQQFTNEELLNAAETYIGGQATTVELAIASIAASLLVLARNSEKNRKTRWTSKLRTT